MLVVSDSSPINVLVRIGYIDALPKLFQTIAIPPAVERELSQAGTPHVVREWLGRRPSWLEVRKPSYVDSTLTRDPGECEAICLAREIMADAILLDDLRARHIAEGFGLNVTGTVGILDLAAEQGLLPLPEAIHALRQTDFRISQELLTKALQADALRRPRRNDVAT